MEIDDVLALNQQALDARSQSYSPYSKFRVGAALLAEDGQVFTGCNVENCSYGGAICAERTAYVKAVSSGVRKFKAIAISSDLKDDWITPCGICRQFMVEFSDDEFPVIAVKAGDYKVYRVWKLGELLPYAFRPHKLQ